MTVTVGDAVWGCLETQLNEGAAGYQWEWSQWRLCDSSPVGQSSGVKG